MKKFLGRIKSASFGTDFERPYLYGLWLEFEGDGWGVSDGGCFTVNINPEIKWEGERVFASDFARSNLFLRIAKILEEARVQSVDLLKDLPVEVTFADEGDVGSKFESFRFLNEVRGSVESWQGYLSKISIDWPK